MIEFTASGNRDGFKFILTRLAPELLKEINNNPDHNLIIITNEPRVKGETQYLKQLVEVRRISYETLTVEELRKHDCQSVEILDNMKNSQIALYFQLHLDNGQFVKHIFKCDKIDLIKDLERNSRALILLNPEMSAVLN
jgi:hypothetical protein